MKKLKDKKIWNKLNIQEQDTKILPDIPEQPIIIEREKPIKPKKQEHL